MKRTTFNIRIINNKQCKIYFASRIIQTTKNNFSDPRKTPKSPFRNNNNILFVYCYLAENNKKWGFQSLTNYKTEYNNLILEINDDAKSELKQQFVWTSNQLVYNINKLYFVWLLSHIYTHSFTHRCK